MNTPCLRWLVVLGALSVLAGTACSPNGVSAKPERDSPETNSPAAGQARGRSSSIAGRPADGECRSA